jgi:hypothetical protein
MYLEQMATTYFMTIDCLNYDMAKSKPTINGTYGSTQLFQM